MSWYERSLAVIKKQRLKNPELSTPELKKFCSQHYPFAERTGCAYKAWLKAMRETFGRTHPEPETNQQSLELENVNENKTVWIGQCPKCGPVRIESPVKPERCNAYLKQQRGVIRCREILTDVRSTRGEK